MGDSVACPVRALLGIDQTAEQMKIWQVVLNRGLSVRETEDLVKHAKKVARKPAKSQPSSEHIYLSDVADDLSRYYGTKVSIQRQKNRGTVAIEFYSDEDLDRLLSLLKKTD